MNIDIFHDTACPWYRIGHKHLFDALKQWQGEAVAIQWHPFLLDDTIPREGVEFRQFMQLRKGIAPYELNQLFDYTQQAGKVAGVKLDFAKVPLAVNTSLSHRLIALVPEANKAAVVEAVYQAYFEDGLNIGDIDVLVSLAEAAGVDSSELRHQLSGDAVLGEVVTEARQARHNGIISVPFFLINQMVRVDGSHSSKVFLRAFNRAVLLTSLNPPYWY